MFHRHVGNINYQAVEFEQISDDVVGIWRKVLIEPWPIYAPGSIPLSIYTVLELETVPSVCN